MYVYIYIVRIIYVSVHTYYVVYMYVIVTSMYIFKGIKHTKQQNHPQFIDHHHQSQLVPDAMHLNATNGKIVSVTGTNYYHQ